MSNQEFWDFVFNFVEIFGVEYEELNQEKIVEVIVYLEWVIVNVLLVIEFINICKYVVLGLLLSIVFFIMSGMWFIQGKLGVGVVGLLFGLFGLFFGYQYCNFGKIFFMCLICIQFWVDSLLVLVELVDVIDFSVKVDML